jgi:hypothetical protein
LTARDWNASVAVVAALLVLLPTRSTATKSTNAIPRRTTVTRTRRRIVPA